MDALKPAPFQSEDGKVTGWKVTIPGERPLATPAIAEGKLYLGGGFGSHEFYAFDAASGDPIWMYRTADDGPTAAVVERGMVAFNTESCELEVISTSGTSLWKKWLGDPLMSMPAIADGTVYIAYPDSRGDRKYYISAFDLIKGTESWKSSLPGEVITAPIVEGEHLYLATVDGSILALDRFKGTKTWLEREHATSAPSIWKGQVYFSRREEMKILSEGKQVSQQVEIVAARGRDATVTEFSTTRRAADYLDYAKRSVTPAFVASSAWDSYVGLAGLFKGPGPMALARSNIGQDTVHGIWSYQGSRPSISEGHLYTSMGDRIQRVDPATGTVVWNKTLKHGGKESSADYALSPPSIVNGKVFVASTTGDVYALTALSGDALWKVSLGEAVSSQPVIVKGRIYIATAEGTLFSLETGDVRDDGWFMWGATAAHNGLNGR